MKIQVLGSGCPICKKLHELTQQAVSDLGLKEEVEYITDISKIIEMGVISSPVLAIDGKPVMIGSGNLDMIKKAITEGKDAIQTEKKSGCSCGGNC